VVFQSSSKKVQYSPIYAITNKYK